MTYLEIVNFKRDRVTALYMHREIIFLSMAYILAVWESVISQGSLCSLSNKEWFSRGGGWRAPRLENIVWPAGVRVVCETNAIKTGSEYGYEGLLLLLLTIVIMMLRKDTFQEIKRKCKQGKSKHPHTHTRTHTHLHDVARFFFKTIFFFFGVCLERIVSITGEAIWEWRGEERRRFKRGAEY